MLLLLRIVIMEKKKYLRSKKQTNKEWGGVSMVMSDFILFFMVMVRPIIILNKHAYCNLADPNLCAIPKLTFFLNSRKRYIWENYCLDLIAGDLGKKLSVLAFLMLLP